ncbi:MAG: flagellar basal body P-ring protein FlgI [Pirellulales bacterium]
MKKPLLIACCLALIAAMPASARTRLKDICRIKGQEENVLHGMGLVVGLSGTGEANDAPTMRAIARAMEIMGNPITQDPQKAGLDELKKVKNASLVMVTATVPATGARRGDHVDCFVSAINGKSLEGGRLAFASLQGPNIQDPRVYALCQGQVVIDNPSQLTVGVIHGGCQIEADIFTPFVREGHITLVLDKNHADFQTANDIVQQIRDKSLYSESGSKYSEQMVRAIDATNIVVRIPEVFAHDPVAFASDLLEIRIEEPQTESRVVINPRAGTIVISGEVEIGDVIVSHKNVVVDASTGPAIGIIDLDESNKPKLQALVDQLTALKVPTSDMIEIIQGIERNGKLHGRLIIE